MAGISRRGFIAGALSAAGVGVAAGAGVYVARDPDTPSRGRVPFYGMHQAGIATAQPDRLLFAAYDLTTESREEVADLLHTWTIAANRLTAGLEVVDGTEGPLAPPADTGEATGLDPAQLTLAFGVGPSLFVRDGRDRYGLAGRRPEALIDLPAFPGDALDPRHSGGDLCVQACGNDPQVVYHAVRNLTRLARGVAVLRWTQTGFGRTSSTTSAQETPRNLMGFKDGTNNLHASTPDFEAGVWVRPTDDPSWMRGGSYVVVRRIRMRIEVWDRASLLDQELTIGRRKLDGAPLGGREERAPIDLEVRGANGQPVVPGDAHVRLANQAAHGISLLRRGYSFTDGVDPRTGQLDAGLFFIAFQRDPREQFVPMQSRLASDALNEYIQHVGSAVFAVFPGAPDASHSLGANLFA